MNANGFVDEDKRFNAAWGDWFVIGGRWTGELTGEAAKLSTGDLRVNAGNWTGCLTESPLEEEPGTRNPYRELGYEGDAQVVTEELYDRFLSHLEGTSEDYTSFADLQCDPVSREFIGNKWLVVVDLHG